MCTNPISARSGRSNKGKPKKGKLKWNSDVRRGRSHMSFWVRGMGKIWTEVSHGEGKSCRGEGGLLLLLLFGKESEKGSVDNKDIFVLKTPVGASKRFENIDTARGSGERRKWGSTVTVIMRGLISRGNRVTHIHYIYHWHIKARVFNEAMKILVWHLLRFFFYEEITFAVIYWENLLCSIELWS